MDTLQYGVWDDRVYDCRNGQDAAPLPVSGLEQFAPDNPVRVFVADRGFLVFDPAASLVDAFRQYMQRAVDESCGKCAPCRIGTRKLLDELEALQRGKLTDRSLPTILELASLVAESSLCGLGRTCTLALAAAIRHFPEVFAAEARSGAVPAAQPGMVYVTAPCIEACPAKLDVPRYIDHIRAGNPAYALGVILDKYPLAATCGRVCVRFCEQACRRRLVDGAVGIKMLKRFAADRGYQAGQSLFDKSHIRTPALAQKKRVAVVGAGGAGITCAYQLLRKGIDVDVLEMQDKAGGMASVGIPSYRLPKDVLRAESEDAIQRLGGRLCYGRRLGQDYSVSDLFSQGYDAVFLGYGARQGSLLGIAGEDPSADGYYSGINFLRAVHDQVEYHIPFELKGEVVVVGAGNVAMDCVRSAVRLGASKVHLVYRRTRDDMPADHEEIEAAEKEGVVFHCLNNPSRLICENGRVTGVEVVEMRQTGTDSRGRSQIESIPGSERVVACDYLIAAIGQQVDRGTLSPDDGITINRYGCIEADPDTLETSRTGVFAGGDCVLGPLTLIHAMGQGAKAAHSIVQYLSQGHVTVQPRQRMQRLLASNRLLATGSLNRPLARKNRFTLPELDVAERVGNFSEVEQVITQAEAYFEADRCLRCYRIYSVITGAPLEDAVPTAECA